MAGAADCSKAEDWTQCHLRTTPIYTCIEKVQYLPKYHCHVQKHWQSRKRDERKRRHVDKNKIPNKSLEAAELTCPVRHQIERDVGMKEHHTAR